MTAAIKWTTIQYFIDIWSWVQWILNYDWSIPISKKTGYNIKRNNIYNKS